MACEGAKLVATLAHGAQKYGEKPYSFHLQMVVDILAFYGYGRAQIAAGWLHDVLEDTSVSYDDLADAFGVEVASIVDACTGRGINRKARQADIKEKLTLCPAACAVKLADRMANLNVCFSEDHRPKLSMYIREDPEFSLTVEKQVEAAMWRDYRRMVEQQKPIAWLSR